MATIKSCLPQRILKRTDDHGQLLQYYYLPSLCLYYLRAFLGSFPQLHLLRDLAPIADLLFLAHRSFLLRAMILLLLDILL